MSNPAQDRCSPLLAAERTRVLIGCYRKGEAADPEVYARAVATVLASYPEDVVRYVTDPVYGIPGKIQWLPNIAEVKAACDAEMKPRLELAAKLKREQDTRALLAPPARPSDEDRAKHVEKYWEPLKREMAQREAGPVKPTESPDAALARLAAECGVSPEQVNAIPTRNKAGLSLGEALAKQLEEGA